VIEVDPTLHAKGWVACDPTTGDACICIVSSCNGEREGVDATAGLLGDLDDLVFAPPDALEPGAQLVHNETPPPTVPPPSETAGGYNSSLVFGTAKDEHRCGRAEQ